MTSAGERAIYYKPEIAFDRGALPLEPRVFQAERDAAFSPETRSGFIDLDMREHFNVSWPCTTPSLLARYVMLSGREPLATCSNSSGDVFFVLHGCGETSLGDEEVFWNAGDSFCVPGGAEAQHRSAGSKTILLQVSDQPLFNYLGARPDGERDSLQLVHYSKQRIDEGLDEVHDREGPQNSAGKCVVFVTAAMAHLRLVTPSMLASVNSLEPGGGQRPHRHNSVALTIAMECDNVYSMVAGRRIDWVEGAVMLTPAGAVHSHHNRGAKMMRSFVAQDTGLHTHLQTTSFSWDT